MSFPAQFSQVAGLRPAEKYDPALHAIHPHGLEIRRDNEPQSGFRFRWFVAGLAYASWEPI